MDTNNNIEMSALTMPVERTQTGRTKLLYPAIFKPFGDRDGYCVVFPDLPGCVTQGDSLTDAVEMAIDAASGWVLDELEDGGDIPPASKPNEIVPEEKDEFVNLVVLDIDSYAEKYGNKAVRKNCTIPAWLNTKAEAMNINFSNVLKEALLERLKIN